MITLTGTEVSFDGHFIGDLKTAPAHVKVNLKKFLDELADIIACASVLEKELIALKKEVTNPTTRKKNEKTTTRTSS